MDKVKIGFIGVGFMGQLAHLQNYVQLDECEVVAVADARPELAKKVAAAYGIPTVYENYNDLLADKSIVGVVASQQFSNHVNIVPDVLNAGKHILTEKPLCIFADNGRPLVKLAQDKGLIHMVGYHKRSDPATEYAMNVINGWKSTGEVGAMRYIRLTMPPGNWVGGSKMPIGSADPYPPFTPEGPLPPASTGTPSTSTTPS
ncbi:MAG: Gfo/Idh/MocA family protein [Eubacteriales bacterium]